MGSFSRAKVPDLATNKANDTIDTDENVDTNLV